MKVLFLDLSKGARKEEILLSLIKRGFPLEKLNEAIKTVDFPFVEEDNLLVPKDSRDSERHLEEVFHIVSRMILPVEVMERVNESYRLLAEAEAKVHGESLDMVHFHEVGSDWAITMVVGICYAVHYLGFDKVFFSPINVGSGKVMTSHGLLDVPAPATEELLKGLLWYKSEVEKELATPASVAVLRSIGTQVDGWQKEGVSTCIMEFGENQIQKTKIQDHSYSVVPIGVLRTPYKDAAPYQPVEHDDAEFRIELYPEYKDALEGLKTFRYIIVLFWLDRASYKSVSAHPPWISGRVGLFASRSPNRPSKIGLSVVRLLDIIDSTLIISPIDAFDETKVIDIKPYVASLDAKSDANDGWATGNKHLELHRKGIPHRH